MDYLIPIACVAGGIWTGYLVGQFTSIKETNRRLALLSKERDEQKEAVDYWKSEYDRCQQLISQFCNRTNDLSKEVDRQAGIIARYQAKAPERGTNGKFTSRKPRVTAELQAYVASKKAVS